MDPYRSATVLLPIALERAHLPLPYAVDVGCGDMGWLLALHELSPTTALLGIDIEPEDHIPADTRQALNGTWGSSEVSYLQDDLRSLSVPAATSPWRWCSLVICLETAEHLHPEYGEHLVDIVTSLVSETDPALDPSILWSAALPGQGPYGEPDDHGAHHNEQPAAYWNGLFAARGFVIDETTTARLRDEAVRSPDVDPWYQHITLFHRGG